MSYGPHEKIVVGRLAPRGSVTSSRYLEKVLPSQIGERAEAAVMAALVAAGKDVLLPLGQRRYDLAYEEDGRLMKVQCKSGLLKDGALSFRTHSVGRRSLRDYRGEVDYFGVYCHERREVYLVPIADVPTSRACLRFTPPRNGQSAGIRLAAQYVIKPFPDPDTTKL